MKKTYWLVPLIAALLLVIPSRVAFAAEEKEKEEGNETKMKLANVPAAVQKTLAEESKGAKIETVDKETDEGKTIYEADVQINGKNYEIKVLEDGTLLSKKLDMEEAEKDKKDEKDAKGKDKDDDEKNEKESKEKK